MELYIKPQHLKKGDTIGIISPSSTIKFFHRRLKRAISFLKKSGLNVVLAKNAKISFGHNSGTIQQRVDDIHEMFLNKNIKAIICSTGGLTSNAILPFIDYKIIANNPKIFCGYSDITALNLAISKKTNLITFNGPTILPTFGEYGGAFKFTLKSFENTLFSTKIIGKLSLSQRFSEENLWWETEDNRASKTKKSTPWRTIYKGTGKGILVGGNLDTLCILGGTEFFPDFSNSILFLEEEGESTSSVERKLTYLEHLGVFNKISGFFFGRPYNFTVDNDNYSLYNILSKIGLRYSIPIIADVDCGHTSPMLTLPIGVKVYMNAGEKEIRILESAVK